MKVSSIQFEIKDAETKKDRLHRMGELLDSCRGSNLIVLPEIWNTGYFNFDRYQEESESKIGETSAFLGQKAKDLNAYIMAGSWVERDNGKLYNTSFLFNPSGQLLATYRKIHLFGFGSDETKILTRGSQVVTVPTEFGILGLATCYDLRFPEMFRKMLDQNVDFILVSAAWPYPRLDHWRELNHVRAFENECYLISSNCAGVTRGNRFLGHSMVVDPWGTPIAAAGDHESIITVDVDSKVVKQVREIFPPVNDRVSFE